MTSDSTQPLRLALVVSNLEFGGAQRQIVELANHLDPAAFDTHVITLSDYVPLAERLADRSRLHVVAKRFKFDVTTPLRLARLLRRLRTEVAHAFLYDAMIATRIAGRLAKVRAIIGSERNTDYHLKRVQMLGYWLTRRQVDLIIANSNAGAAFNQRMLGHSAEQYRVVHNGVDTERFQPAARTAGRAELGLGEGDFVLGMFASFKQQKNHPLLLRAARQLVDEIPSLRLLFVGDELHQSLQASDAYKQSVNALVDELGLRQRCVFVGNRPDPERLYPLCDIKVLPSTREGTPNVLLEAMACGVPIVATDVADNALVAPDGKVGFIVPLNQPDVLADRIRRLHADPQLRDTLGAAGRQWVQKEFSLRRLTEKTAAVYAEALALRSATAGAAHG